MRSLVPKLLTTAIIVAASLVWVPAASAAPTSSPAEKAFKVIRAPRPR
jgi:hypothetical protein